MRRLANAVACALALFAGVAHAADGPFMPFAGGGAPATDCLLVTEIVGVAAAHDARCTDGDPACDADGAANGTCVFRLRLCTNAAGAPACRPDVVTRVDAQAGGPFGALARTAADLAMPSDAPGTCSDPATVAVPARSRVVLRARATTASGRVDRDRVALVCRPRPGSATFATIQRAIFDRSCATSSCHGAARAGGLDLTAGHAFAALVGVPAANPAAATAGLFRVVPGDPDASFLVAKLAGTLSADEGTPMPQVGGALPAARLALVRRWIAAGAPAAAPF